MTQETKVELAKWFLDFYERLNLNDYESENLNEIWDIALEVIKKSMEQ